MATRSSCSGDRLAVGQQRVTDFPNRYTDVLDLLADALDHLPGQQLDRTAVQVLHSRLAAVLVALEEDDSLDERLRAHIRRTVSTLRTCVDEFEIQGESKTMEALDAMWAAVLAAEAQSATPNRWTEFRDKFFIPTAAGLLANAPGLVMQLGQL